MSASLTSIESGFRFDHSFQQLNDFFVNCAGAQFPQPKMIRLNTELAQQLGLNAALDQAQLAQLFSGSAPASGSQPLAQIYAGHQFGQFNPQLGDGRALMLGEVFNDQQQRLDIQLKGSGKTPFSRGGDGKAALGPMLREYILGEAMHALNIPTTRGLAIVTTGESIMRQKRHPGAVFTRVASSHIRVGTFQYFAARGKLDKVTQLADYTLQRHFSDLQYADQPYLHLLKAVAERQARLVAQWMLVGFIHGVMNTDNVAISGETIDYGPCAFIDVYDPQAVFSSIDRTGRYALSNQPIIAQWNMARFAECLLHLLDDNEEQAISKASEVIEQFADRYHHHWLQGMSQKLGLCSVQEDDSLLAQNLLTLMHKHQVDFTQFFRQLSSALNEPCMTINRMFNDDPQWLQWMVQWHQRLSYDDQQPSQRLSTMQANNPLYIARNHLVEEAIEAAEEQGDLGPFEQLLMVLKQPYTERPKLEKYTQGAPQDFGPYQTFCGT